METMEMADLIRFARIPLELNVKPGEEVLILTDAEIDERLPKAMAAAARSIGAEPSILVMAPRGAPNQEPPRAVAGAMKGADVLVQMSSHSVLHTEAARAALAAGVKWIGMSAATVRSMTEGAATADPRDLYAVTERVAGLMTEASSARVTSPEGTDVVMDLRGRSALVLAGLFVPGKYAGGFPAGEAPIAPVEGSTQGTIVFDTTMNPIGRLIQPVVLRIEKGRIVAIEGRSEAEELRALLARQGDDNCYAIAEFAIGTNPQARITGNMYEDKRKRGTVHFGVGDNRTLGGNIRAALHLDGLILRPTVDLDGRIMVDNGELIF